MIQRVGESAGGMVGGGVEGGCKAYKLEPTCPPPSLICTSAAQKSNVN